MGMIGNQIEPGVQLKVSNDSYNGDGSTTTFTLSQSVSATTDIEVIVDNVQQSPYDSSYSVSGTTLTFSEAPATGTNNIYVFYRGSKHHSTAQMIPDDGSVHTSKIASGAVDHSKMHTNATLPITRDMTNNRVGINKTNPTVSLEIGATQTREEIRLQSTGGGAQAVLGTYGGTESYVGSTNNCPIYFRTNGTNRAQIDTSGRYLNSNQPSFAASRTDGHVQANSDVIWNSVIHNTGNHYDSSNGRFTAPVAGDYMIMVHCMAENNAQYLNKYYEIRKNGVGFKRAYSSNHTACHVIWPWFGVISLDAGDYINVHNVNMVIYATGSHYTYFSGYLLG